jgi:hypothetical protein
MPTYLYKTVASIGTAILVAAAFATASTPVAAQTAASSAATSAASKPAASKPAAPKKKLKVSPTASRIELKSDAKNLAAGIEAAEAALTPAELAIAERVYVGRIPCELGAFVTVEADKKLPGYFDIHGKTFKYRMFPVPTTTGAIRLEDQKSGAVWLQLGNKSMLMNQKNGTRLADECMGSAQLAMAEAIKLNPPPSLLDAPKPAASGAMPAAIPASGAR